MIARFLQWVQDNSDILFDLIRIYIGVGLVVRGILAFSNPGFLTQWLAMFGVTGAAADAARFYVVVAHIIGGGLLTLGFLTRIAALVNVPVLFGAVFFIHYPEGLAATDQSLEFSALVLFLLALFVVRGSGRLSLMSRLRTRRLASQG